MSQIDNQLMGYSLIVLVVMLMIVGQFTEYTTNTDALIALASIITVLLGGREVTSPANGGQTRDSASESRSERNGNETQTETDGSGG